MRASMEAADTTRERPMTASNRFMVGLWGLTSLLILAFQSSAQSEDLVIVYEKPDVDLSHYRQILVTPLNLENTRLVPPPWVENADPKLWSLTPENRAFLRDAFASSMRAGIEAGGKFQVTTEAAPGALQIEVHLVSLTPWAARGEEAETLGSGQLTFEAYVRDSQTADMLALFKGTQQVGQDYQENTEFNKASGLTEHFTNWGRNVSRRLAARQAP